ncbi:8668_t:CDS:2, partial [Funneliformis mosseae]
INNNESSSEKLNFLVKNPKKSKEKQSSRGGGRYPDDKFEDNDSG